MGCVECLGACLRVGGCGNNYPHSFLVLLVRHGMCGAAVCGESCDCMHGMCGVFEGVFEGLRVCKHLPPLVFGVAVEAFDVWSV